MSSEMWISWKSACFFRGWGRFPPCARTLSIYLALAVSTYLVSATVAALAHCDQTPDRIPDI